MAEPVSPSAEDDPRAVGSALRAARRRAGLTGAELARRAGISQPTVSRLETGVSLADPAEVHRLAGAMELSDAETEALVALARRAQQRMNDVRTEPRGLPQLQESIHRIEQNSAVVRVFNPSLVPGLLQTSSYAQVVITNLGSLTAADPTSPETHGNLLSAVSRRMARQEVLGDAGKKFFFVITESVLGAGVGTPEDMIVQIRHLRRMHALPHVSLRILPARAFVKDFALHSFEMVDDQVVIIDLFNTSMTTQGRADIRLYRDLFERLHTAATGDVDALLDEYTAYYRGQIGD
ncbi:helix-turn-helix transcriptional regulator [Actinoplanes sp. NBRC 101535]|uniref:helix-turn-helix domain-containing protein n=1 Tax=Actinoplanes sp. NBRC 101535 TaxID=3032196 RepID=UPI00255657EA|nr:helix-turn-helix transcriptional regulator [Actinoplanes sp. NBRC 101535]